MFQVNSFLAKVTSLCLVVTDIFVIRYYEQDSLFKLYNGKKIMKNLNYVFPNFLNRFKNKRINFPLLIHIHSNGCLVVGNPIMVSLRANVCVTA